MIMRKRHVIMGPCNVNRGMWNVISEACNVNMGPWNVIMGPVM